MTYLLILEKFAHAAYGLLFNNNNVVCDVYMFIVIFCHRN